jgi:hypothetical protein
LAAALLGLASVACVLAPARASARHGRHSVPAQPSAPSAPAAPAAAPADTGESDGEPGESSEPGDEDVEGYWLGEDLAFRERLRPNEPNVLAGWQVGLGNWLTRSIFVGGGWRIGWSGSWQTSVVARLGLGTVPDTDYDDSQMFFLQLGPLLMHGQLGIDAELGYDWSYYAVYVGGWLEPQSGAQPAGWAVTVGGRLALIELPLIIMGKNFGQDWNP